MNTNQSHFIMGKWLSGFGNVFTSFNPATELPIWQGRAATSQEIQSAITAAKEAFTTWSHLDFSTRAEHIKAFGAILSSSIETLAVELSKENGKPLWESKNEINAIINKIAISIDAYHNRCPDLSKSQSGGQQRLRHCPHGVLAVLGPYNFPGHLPHGHIIPALLAGNTLVFKPSELVPNFAQLLVECWQKSGLPDGVLNLVQGGAETGKILAHHQEIDGVLFTGSWPTGRRLAEMLASTPYKILALEMGGNNPLIVHNINDLKTAAYLTIQSAFITSGQRCTCARRLIVPSGKPGDEFLSVLIEMIQKIHVGAYTEKPEPFMGPLISAAAAEKIVETQKALLAHGGEALVAVQHLQRNKAFLSPGLIDVTKIGTRSDEEVFGPLLQLIRVPDFPAAIAEANHTKYGLSAGLLSDEESDFSVFLKMIRAGVISWNTPLTGASSAAPFGGIGHSGNNRPSAFYAADYCSYPVSSLEIPKIAMPATLTPGISLE